MKEVLRLLPCLLILSTAAHGENFIDINAKLSYSDNVGNAHPLIDRVGDSIANASYVYGMPYFIGDFGSLNWHLKAGVESYARYSGLSNLVGEGGVKYKYKFGLGFDRPWISAGGRLGYRYSRDKLRDAVYGNINLSVGKRFGAAFNTRAELDYSVENASSTVFDRRAYTAGVSLDYDVSDAWLLFGGFARDHGDMVSTATPSAWYAAARVKARVRDDAIGGGRVAYRLVGNTNLYRIGVNYFIDDGAAVEAVIRHRHATSGYMTDYKTTVYSLEYIRNF